MRRIFEDRTAALGAVYKKEIKRLKMFYGIRSETARFSDDKTRFSERTDVEAVGIGVPHADPKTRLSAEKPRFSRQQ